MANYAILRVAKLTSFGNIAASGQHNFRERVTKNADEKRTHLNQLDGAQNTADLAKAVSDLLPMKRRKDAVLCIEYMISASPEHFGDDWREVKNHGADYFKDAIEWLEKRHGKSNVVCTTVHLDESTPHLAAYVVPRTVDGRLSAKDFTGGRSVLAKMQTSFASEVGIEHGLIRGVERSNAVHQDNAKIAPMTAERLQLRKRVKVLEDEIDRLVKSAGADGAALAAAQKALEQGEDELAMLSNKFLALEKKSEHQLKTNIQFNADINVLEAQAKVDAEAKTTAQSDLVKIQGELVKVQGTLAIANATARADATTKTAVQRDLVAIQGELVKVQGELVKAQGALAIANATARADATTKTAVQRDLVAIQGELVKVQGALAIANATAKADATTKTAVQGDLIKANSDYAEAKIIIDQANEYIKKIFDENKNMKKSMEGGSKLDAYTKNLEAQLVVSNEKLAVALQEKATAVRALVKSGEKSPALLKTADGHDAAAEQLRRLNELTAASNAAQGAFLEKWKGALEWDEKRAVHGVVVDVCGNQAIYNLGRLKMLRTFKQGEVVPSLSATEQEKKGIAR